MFHSTSGIISILFSIGSFLGIPYNSATHSNSQPLLPKINIVATSSISNPFSTPIFKTPAATSTDKNKEKLPYFVLKAPAYKTIAPQTFPTSSASTLEERIRAAIVNIYCTTQVGNTVTIVTGSGVIIDSRGIILTNAHVADHILILDYINNPRAECVIRKGSPATSVYKAVVIYISPAWLRLHGHQIYNSFQPQETGEDDYALLAITGSATPASLPVSFPSIAPDVSTNFLNPNTPVFGTGYPADSLNSPSIIKNLPLQMATLNITDNYTFFDGGMDLIRTSATSIAENGASGGGIINQNGELIGLIATTIQDSNNLSLRDLQALTLSYINSDLRNATGLNLTGFLRREVSTLISDFRQNRQPALAPYLPH